MSNPWLARRPLNIAHQGGQLEAPGNTVYAFARALTVGAHMLELDVHATLDGEVVVVHDATVDRTTQGRGWLSQLTLQQLRRLDAAYWFVDGVGASQDAAGGAYSWRGVATGQRPPPVGFTASDFTIPTLERVLARFPDTPMSIDIKRTAPETAGYEQRVAELLNRFDRADDVLVASFFDRAIEAFRHHAPRLGTGMGPVALQQLWLRLQDGPCTVDAGVHAVQVPLTYHGTSVVSEAFVAAAHDSGLAVHVWTVDDRPTMHWLLDIGVDGIVTDRPSVLAEVLRGRPTEASAG